MLDNLMKMFKEPKMQSMRDLLRTLGELFEYFGEDYLKDPSLKNAAIDAVIQLLENEKTSTMK